MYRFKRHANFDVFPCFHPPFLDTWKKFMLVEFMFSFDALPKIRSERMRTYQMVEDSIY